MRKFFFECSECNAIDSVVSPDKQSITILEGNYVSHDSIAKQKIPVCEHCGEKLKPRSRI